MSTTLELLAMPHTQALDQMVSDSFQSGFGLSDIEVGPGYLRSDLRTGYLIKSSATHAADPLWSYYGTIVFTHYRVKIEDVFYGLNLRIKMPATGSGGLNLTTNDVVSKLSSIYNLHFDLSDYYNDSIVSPGMIVYTLKMTPTSLRWMGQIDIELHPDI